MEGGSTLTPPAASGLTRTIHLEFLYHWHERCLILYRNFQISFTEFWAIMSLMNFSGNKSAAVRRSKSKDLQNAAEDFRYLLNRRYPRKAALELVGNRFGLTFDERHLLHRGVFSSADSKSRRKRIVPITGIRNKDLAIDGHNVLITIEAALSGRALVLADDGFIRDISGLSGSFRKSKVTETAIQLVLNVSKKWKPRKTLFLFDAPISMSGKLAREIRDRLNQANLPGDAVAVKVPEKILIGFPGVIASSDTAIIDRSEKVLDLAGYIITKKIGLKSFLQWKRRPLVD